MRLLSRSRNAAPVAAQSIAWLVGLGPGQCAHGSAGQAVRSAKGSYRLLDTAARPVLVALRNANVTQFPARSIVSYLGGVRSMFAQHLVEEASASDRVASSRTQLSVEWLVQR